MKIKNSSKDHVLEPGDPCGPFGLPASFNRAYEEHMKAQRNNQLGNRKSPWRKRRDAA